MGELHRLHNPIQNYAWGRKDSLARLRGEPPASQPEAELWVGAHPQAPSEAEEGHDDAAARLPLPELFQRRPELLPEGREGFPFLLKILAIGGPLSLQVHPDPEQARAGYAKEEEAGVPADAAERNYKDSSDKPETVVALTPIRILSGIRPAHELKEIGQALNLTWLAELAGYGADEIVTAIFTKSAESTQMALAGTVNAAIEYSTRHPFDEDHPGDPAGNREDRLAAVADLILMLHDAYPGDRGIMVAAAMNQLFLKPGEAAHTPAGQVHAYLDGTAVEIMAPSDNVMRAGLTGKHIDIPEMLSILIPEQPAPEIQQPEPLGPGAARYRLWDPGLTLTRLDLGAGAGGVGTLEHPVDGLAALLCTEGEVTVTLGEDSHRLTGTQAVLHTGGADRLTLTGEGQIFLAEAR